MSPSYPTESCGCGALYPRAVEPAWYARVGPRLHYQALDPGHTPIKKTAFILMKIRSSDHASAIDASSGLELAVWTQFSRKYGRRLSIGNTGKIWRVDTFDANDPVQLSNLLEQTELWVCDHTKQSASVSWPPPVLGSKLGVNPCTVIRVLSSLGTLDLHVITVNLENITSNLDSTIALQHVPNIENVSFHVAMGRKYSDLLDIHGEGGNTFPLWFNFSIGQLALSLR
jgi:hypothetical protein